MVDSKQIIAYCKEQGGVALYLMARLTVNVASILRRGKWIMTNAYQVGGLSLFIVTKSTSWK